MTSVELTVIGYIRTEYPDPVNMPIEPRAGGDGVVTIAEEFREGLADLDGFEHIWLLFHLHRSSAPRLRVVPFMDTNERGLFATRAPARPSPVGISCVRLESVDQISGRLAVSEVDLVDGSAILDIKPYVPRFDAHPESRTGWMESRHRSDSPSSDDRFSR